MNLELCDIPRVLGNSVYSENYLNLNNFSLLCIVLFYKKYTNIFENILFENGIFPLIIQLSCNTVAMTIC